MKKTFGQRLAGIILPANPKINGVMWGIITLAGVLGIFSSYHLTHTYYLVEGKVSDVAIEADKSVTYEDSAKTEENRREAAERVSDIFVFDSSVLESQVDQINYLFRAWEDLILLPEDIVPPVTDTQSGRVSGLNEKDDETALPGESESSVPGATSVNTDTDATGAASGPENSGISSPDSLGPGADNLPDSAAIGMIRKEPPKPTKLEQAAPYIAQLQIRESTARAILGLSPTGIDNLRDEAISIMSQQWSKGVRANEVEQARRKILDEIYLRVINEDQSSFLQAVFRFIDLQANFIFDQENTERARVEAANKELPVYATVYRNQSIIRKGEIVTAKHIEMLKALGYQRSDAPYIMLIGIALLTCCAFFLLSRYLSQFSTKNQAGAKRNALLSVMFLMTLGIARLIVVINISLDPVMAEQISYLIPSAMGAILVAILLDNWLGVIYGVLTSVFIGLLSAGAMSYPVVSIAGCVIGVYSISLYTNRSEWAKAGLMIALVNIWMIGGFGIINNYPRMTILIGMVIGAINGFFSPILAYGSLPFFEAVFKMTTSVSLMELADSRQPLLKELLLKAPGTYHHSILVGNLAETAAYEIGADYILARVGAYYHDIGKMKRPYFFSENQMRDANPHDRLTPALSALILQSHVKDGLEIGIKGKLPEKVLDFINQHHGDGVMMFFYNKAISEAESPESVHESDYRYPGPRPQSKETALVMLADSVEAAIRSMRVSGDKLETVKKLINDKVADGQLEDSGISLSDLKAISEVFAKVLNGIYHNRVEYPDNVLAALRDNDASGL